jgi:hypothetical protein
MDVITHQAPGPDQETIPAGSFAQEIEVDGMVGIAVEDGHPAIASLRHMVRQAGDYCASDSGHRFTNGTAINRISKIAFE